MPHFVRANLVWTNCTLTNFAPTNFIPTNLIRTNFGWRRLCAALSALLKREKCL